jgi:hypothetical protein
MAKGYRNESSDLIIIPSIPRLEDRLAVIKREEKRIEILIRAAKELAGLEPPEEAKK